jgi:hypothetical protein
MAYFYPLLRYTIIANIRLKPLKKGDYLAAIIRFDYAVVVVVVVVVVVAMVLAAERKVLLRLRQENMAAGHSTY